MYKCKALVEIPLYAVDASSARTLAETLAKSLEHQFDARVELQRVDGEVTIFGP
jgi:CRISPR/Cas system-associated protein Csm6